MRQTDRQKIDDMFIPIAVGRVSALSPYLRTDGMPDQPRLNADAETNEPFE